MYIKAKYPSLYRPYMKTERQGYGSGKNQNSSTVSSINETQSLTFENEAGETFALRAFSRSFDNSFNSYNYIK